MAGAAPAPGGAPLRANMLRTGAKPAAKPPTRPKVRKARLQRAKIAARPGVKKAALHRARPKAPRIRTTKVASRALPAPVRKPTPMQVAAADLATPRAYALIATTICETGPAPVARAYALLGGPPAAPPPPIVEETGTPDSEAPGLTFLPPTIPGFTPVTGFERGFPPVGPPVPPPGGEGGTPPIVPPPGPPPVVLPPGEPPPVTPPGEPPVTPPPGPPPIVTPPTLTPPVVTPPGPPLTPPGAVPEPGTWALMILGFGAVGMALRRGKRSLGSR